MIDLIARDDRTGFGVACALDVERIPYRLITRAEDFDAQLLLVAGDDVPLSTTTLARRVPTVVIGAAARVTGELFGVRSCKKSEGPATISLEETVWPALIRERARRFGKDALRVPSAPAVTPDRPVNGTVLATYRRPDGTVAPAVVRSGTRAYWCLVDLGAAFANLLDEHYLPPVASRSHRLPRTLLALYLRAPEGVRQAIQRRVYGRLQGAMPVDRAAEYPVDPAGWLILELLKAVIRDAAGSLVRVARWPAPYRAAAALTHDLEPTRFAYTQGLERLLDRIARGAHPATVGVVAKAAARYLSDEAATRLAGYDLHCHGLEHRGETLAGGRHAIRRRLTAARRGVQARLGGRMHGFRSPRLDRSPDLLWALDGSGFRYDSSYPDVDRENIATFGAGVRLNVPFRPPVDLGDDRVRPSRCLELPVSAPDCIQPLFAGEDARALGRAVREKIDFVRATGGLYVGIVHGGVFGPRDAARRGAHLGFVRRCLRHPDLWFASLQEVADWWCAREQLELSGRDGRIEVRNGGERLVEGVHLVVETGVEETIHAIPPLAPGARASVDVGRGTEEHTLFLRQVP